jgi:hypothetical protein
MSSGNTPAPEPPMPVTRRAAMKTSTRVQRPTSRELDRLPHSNDRQHERSRVAGASNDASRSTPHRRRVLVSGSALRRFASSSLTSCSSAAHDRTTPAQERDETRA